MPANRRRWREQLDSLALASSAPTVQRKRPKSAGMATRRPLQPLQRQQQLRRLHRADTLQVLANTQKAEHSSPRKCDANDRGIPSPPVPPTPPPSPASPPARCLTRIELTAFCRVLSAASAQRKPRSVVPSLVQQIQDIQREIDTSFTLAFVARPAPKLSRQQRPPGKKNETSWELAGLSLQVNRVIGEGGYGRVVSCRVPRLGGCYAVKMDWKIAHLVWEALVHAELQRETTHCGKLCQYQRLFLAPQLLVVHSDCALMLMQEANCGNLLDMMSVLRTQAMSPAEHETVVMTCAYQARECFPDRHRSGECQNADPAHRPHEQLLACLELLHDCGIVHADAKADNWSLMCRPPQEAADVDRCCCETCQHLAAIWQYAGFSVALIDFGISKIEHFDQGDDPTTPVVYSGATAVSGYECPAMLAGEPWKYDTDLYGVACCIHELLFQTPLELETVERTDAYGSKLYRPAAKLRRYWSTLIWSNLFEMLLNVRDCTVPSRELTSVKAQLAQELQERFSRHGLRLQACCRALVAGLKASHKKKAPAVARKKKQNNK